MMSKAGSKLKYEQARSSLTAESACARQISTPNTAVFCIHQLCKSSVLLSQLLGQPHGLTFTSEEHSADQDSCAKMQARGDFS